MAHPFRMYDPDKNTIMLLWSSGFILVTIINILIYGQFGVKEYDYAEMSVVYDLPNHGQHYDMLIYTYTAAYYIDLSDNEVFTQDGSINYRFQDFLDMAAWIAERTQNEAFQAEALLGHYRSVFTDQIHAQSDEELEIKKHIMTTIATLPFDSLIIDTTLMGKLYPLKKDTVQIYPAH